ncbi:hypothetical protein CI109_106318 [Kwoniella shandongensis]|uniref:Uncharacterized protein n=1 Tax=Kwoniella shandongensis TaxID=1734106 RepID=A0A5M6BNW1_9TREE|nr:uncharacterized protein CI109_007072 [Kwoniella shandongensis]KAA5524584.1 hypothetical protein CI109_007072 [Kwoniella shandongensis]
MSEVYTDQSNYGYTPTPAWCLAFIVLFSVSAAVHSVQAYRYKYWVIYPSLVLGALIEVLGWSGRYWSSQNVLLLTPFLMQICTLIMAPVFFSAYDYVVLGMAIKRLGPQYSLIPANWYFIIFITADLVSLILQAIGGGQAASSAADGAPTQTATNIMVAGIIFQLVSMGVFIFFGIDFMLRATARRPYAFQERRIEAKRLRKEAGVQKDKKRWGFGRTRRTDSEKNLTIVTSDEVAPNKEVAADIENQRVHAEQEHERVNLNRWWILLIAVAISSIMIFIRGIYRSIELVQGWNGYLIGIENFQNGLDGIPMFIAVAIFNFIHPGYLLPRKSSWKGYH